MATQNKVGITAGNSTCQTRSSLDKCMVQDKEK